MANILELEAAACHADWRLACTDVISIRAGHLSGSPAAAAAREVEALLCSWVEANPEKANALYLALRP